MVNRAPESQTNVEIYADAIDAKFGADFPIPEMVHSQLMAATSGMDGSADAASSREEVTLCFGTNQTWNADDDAFTVPVTERIIRNPFAAKRLILLLGSVLKEYESRYGVLDIEIRKLQKT